MTIVSKYILREVEILKANIQNKNSDLPKEKIRDLTAKAIIAEYEKKCMSWALNDLLMSKLKIHGQLADPLPLGMRFCISGLKLGMCLSLAECYEYDATTENTQRLCRILLSCVSTQKRTITSSESGVKLILQWLKNPTPQQQENERNISGASDIVFGQKILNLVAVYSIRRTGKIVKKWFDLAEGEEELAYLKKQSC